MKCFNNQKKITLNLSVSAPQSGALSGVADSGWEETGRNRVVSIASLYLRGRENCLVKTSGDILAWCISLACRILCTSEPRL